MALIDTSIAGTITDFPAQEVHVWNTNTEIWEVGFELYCDELSIRTNAYDLAVMRYELGKILVAGGLGFGEYTPISLAGKYVRVTIHQPDGVDDIVWIGYVTGTAEDRAGIKNISGTNKHQGTTQFFSAVGLEYFLNRNQINSAAIYGDPDPVRIERSLTFNGGTSVEHDNDTKNRGNKDSTQIDDHFLFDDGIGPKYEWTAAEIVDHILTYHGPLNKAGDASPLPYEIATSDVATINGIKPKIASDKKTPFQLLNVICSPNRGFCWWLDVDTTDPFGNPALVRVATVTAIELTLPNDGAVPANADQNELDFDGQLGVEIGVLKVDLSRMYHQVIVRGERMTSTITLGFHDSTLEKDWTDDAETTYKEGVSATMDSGDYAALPEDKQKSNNDAVRREEKQYRVYSAFRIPADWDGKCGDGYATDERNWAIPEIQISTHSVTGGKPITVAGIRFQTHTRMIRGANYHDLDDVVDPTPEGSEPDYKPAFGIIQVATSPDRWQFIDKMSHTGFAESTAVSEHIATSYHLHMQQSVPGVLLQAGGGMAHTAALNHWTDAEPSGTDPEVDYETLRMTVTAEADSYCEAKYPADEDLPADVPIERITIDAGEHYRLDYLAANTVVGLDDGTPIKAIGGVIRDDRQEIQSIARVAFAWYGVERRPMTLTFQYVKNVFRLGMFISTIGSGATQVNVNTVVSAITYNFRQSTDKPTATMTIQTQSDDLDFAELIG